MVRFKNRYVLCEVVSEDPRCRQCIEDRALGLAVRDAIARVHGDYGLACCSISFTGAGETGGPGAAGSLRLRSPVRVSRSEIPERVHRDGAAALPQGLVPAAVLRAALRAVPGEPRPALPLLPQHPARRRSGAPRAWREDGALIIPATTPWCCSGCDRHFSCVTNSDCFQQI
ncbi:ribonuclease P/MRP protein subunit POP5 isoform X1 [Lonchura striata]